jgi:hypothetical protein
MIHTLVVPFVAFIVFPLVYAQSLGDIPALPDLEAGVLILDGEKPLTVGHTASPDVADWNNDGKKDLLVGTLVQGKVFLFLNKGTDSIPRFDGGTPLTAGGKDLQVEYG